MPSVLVIEDDANMRELLVETLEDTGHYAQGAGSASEAIDLARQEPFDLIVSDVRMAGMDGIDAIASIKSFRPKVRTVVITGYADETVPPRAIQTMVDDYLYKPFRLPDFLEVVRRVLGARDEALVFQRLTQKLFEGSRKLLARLGLSKEPHLAALKASRNAAFQGFFVAIRSNHLRREAALELYDQLEEADNAYQRLEEDSGVENFKAVASAFDYVNELVRAKKEAQTLTLHRTRRPGQVPREDFFRLFERIREGTVRTEQFKYAPFLRQVSAARDPDVAGRYREVWGTNESDS